MGGKDKFIEFKKHDGDVVRFGDNTPCLIKGNGFITLDGKLDNGDFLFVDVLKHNLLSVGKNCG